jgi:hypothetical protein
MPANKKAAIKAAAIDHKLIAATFEQIEGCLVCALAAAGNTLSAPAAKAVWAAARLAQEMHAAL